MIHFEFIFASVKKHNSVVAVVCTVCVCACVSLYYLCAGCTGGVWHSGTGVTDVWKPLWPLCGCCELHLGKLVHS